MEHNQGSFFGQGGPEGLPEEVILKWSSKKTGVRRTFHSRGRVSSVIGSTKVEENVLF